MLVVVLCLSIEHEYFIFCIFLFVMSWYIFVELFWCSRWNSLGYCRRFDWSSCWPWIDGYSFKERIIFHNASRWCEFFKRLVFLDSRSLRWIQSSNILQWLLTRALVPGTLLPCYLRKINSFSFARLTPRTLLSIHLTSMIDVIVELVIYYY